MIQKELIQGKLLPQAGAEFKEKIWGNFSSYLPLHPK